MDNATRQKLFRRRKAIKIKYDAKRIKLMEQYIEYLGPDLRQNFKVELDQLRRLEQQEKVDNEC